MSNLIKVDLHVHTNSSYDCCTTLEEFRKLFSRNLVDKIAITDHSVIGLAFELQKEFGDKIIIGEEIMTSGGEIIGLFLTKEIPKLLTPEKTIEEIKKQGGIAYIPHPFDIRRSGIGKWIEYEKIMKSADIIEVYNSRCFTQTPNEQARKFAEENRKLMSAASDAHDWKDVGTSYVVLENFKSPKEFLKNMEKAVLSENKMTMRGFFSPAKSKIHKKFDSTFSDR